MEISVIVPTYKPQEYVWECLDSLVRQTFPKDSFQVILVLNGCSEPYKRDIQNYISRNMKEMNVTFLHTEVSGVSNARNMALNVACGKYVTFIDDDDYVSPTYLEELYSIASQDTISVAYHYAFKDGERKQLSHPLTSFFDIKAGHGKVKYTDARKYFSGPCMKLIPMLYIGNKRFNTKFKNGEDCIFMFSISDKFQYVNFTSNQAIYYRRYRLNSAVTNSRSAWDLLKNGVAMMMAYTKIYVSSPCKYNLGFYVTRMLGAVKNIFNMERNIYR